MCCSGPPPRSILYCTPRRDVARSVQHDDSRSRKEREKLRCMRHVRGSHLAGGDCRHIVSVQDSL